MYNPPPATELAGLLGIQTLEKNECRSEDFYQFLLKTIESSESINPEPLNPKP